MRKTVFFLSLCLALGSVFSGCERNDYQHPMHRSK